MLRGEEMRFIETTGHFDLPGRAADYYDYDYRATATMDDEGPYDHFRQGDKQFAMQHITQPHHNDVLMGRGGKNNQHSGNERLRQFARLYCEEYKISKKKGKSNISRKLVSMVRSLDPPGRFLKKDPTSRFWEDVGDETAREKASQVLRDAVAIVHPGYEETSPQEDNLYAVPSLDETAASSTEGAHAPLEERFSPPTPVQSRFKRARISQAWEELIPGRPSANVVPTYTNPVRYSAGEANAMRYSAGEANAMRYSAGEARGLVGRPPALLSVDRRASSTATAASLLGDLHADVHSGMLSEFDLFNGELLDGGDPSMAAGHFAS